MKVLYFHQHFTSPKGIVGIRSYQMSRELLRRGHAVTVVCGSYHGGVTGLTGPFVGGLRRGMVDGIEVIELDLSYSNSDGFIRRSVTFLRFAARSVWLALTERYDVVFATSTPLTAGIPGIVARWLRGKPFVFEVRDLWPELPKAMGVIRNPLVLWLLSGLEWVSYRSAHRLVGLSPGIVKGIVRRGVDRNKVTLVPNGCDFDIFGNASEPWRPAQVSPSDFLAIFAGTHGTANGLGAVLDAAAELQRRNRGDIKILLIGTGGMKRELVDRAIRERLQNVIFHDPVDKARLSALLGACDMGLQILANVEAFYYGTSPNKFFDYIAAGLPVLTNYPGWVADMVGDYNAGFAVPPDDPAAFADACEAAASDRVRLLEMGRMARRLAENQFGRGVLGARWVECIEAAAGHSSSGVVAG
jgi:glycosyltransferase involved in cell wall biosynthesis